MIPIPEAEKVTFNTLINNTTSMWLSLMTRVFVGEELEDGLRRHLALFRQMNAAAGMEPPIDDLDTMVAEAMEISVKLQKASKLFEGEGK